VKSRNKNVEILRWKYIVIYKYITIFLKYKVCIKLMTRDSSVGMATGYVLDDHGGREFEFHVVQTGSGFHPTSYKMGTGGKAADHSPPTSAEVKKIWIYTSTPPYIFMA
jgi:hypothetical protein